MRRRAGALAVLASLLLAGCSNDGDLRGPQSDVGAVGDCYGQVSTKTVPCSGSHMAETIFVSHQAPAATSDALSPCREAQATYLGQDFNTRLDVKLWVAGDLSWYRCDVLVRNSTQDSSGYQEITGSLKGVLRRGVSVDLQSCLSEAYDPAADQAYIPCSQPHVSQELVSAPAIGTLNEPFPGDVSDRATRACNAAASASGLLSKKSTVEAYYPKNADAWATGERTADCWVTAVDGGVLPPVTATS
jgi:hypothetical protein